MKEDQAEQLSQLTKRVLYMLKLLVCIDDTDNLESIGTPKMASLLTQELEREFNCECSAVTRHQLFVHPDIPYTSHNSSACFQIRILEKDYSGMLQYCSSFLRENTPKEADPGLCVVSLENEMYSNSLMEFGKLAKSNILSKSDAYDLTVKHDIHLSEHGGTGDGIIGALAGAGLRLSGNDGRFQGWTSFDLPNGLISVEELCARGGYDSVQTLQGEELPSDQIVRLVERVKSVFVNQQSVVLVEYTPEEDTHASWKVVHKNSLKDY